MKQILLKAPAKINLYLDIVGIREDGYHLINSIMQAVDLYDKITVTENETNIINITCDNLNIPCDETNIVYKATKKIFEKKNIQTGVSIDIQKLIPVETGMGGGSADGAATIIGLNKLFKLNLTKEEMIEIGKAVGADVPFMIFGGTSFVEGIGEKITSINNIKNGYFLVIKPNENISTKVAYQKIDEKGLMNISDKKYILEAIKKQNIIDIAKYMTNIFELVTPEEILKIKEQLKESGAINSLMTGSGSAVFGIFDDKIKLEKAYSELSKQYKQIFICNPVSHGPIII